MLTSCKTLFRWYFALASIGAVLSLVWLSCIPKDADSSFIFGFSAARFGLMSLLLAGLLCCVGMLFFSSKFAGRWETRLTSYFSSNPNSWERLLGITTFALLTGVTLLWIPPSFLGKYQYGFYRLKPLIAWLSLISLESACVLLGWKFTACPGFIPSIQSDFSAGIARLKDIRTLLTTCIAGCLVGGFLILFFASTAGEILDRKPWMLWFLLAFALYLSILGLFYNHSISKTIPYLFIFLMILGGITNVYTGRVDARQYRAQLSQLSNNEAIALAEKYHYSLSVYHILSKLYKHQVFIIAPGLLKEWNLDENQLRGWVPAEDIIERSYTPVLSNIEASKILDLDPIQVEINTLDGTMIYYFLPPKEENSRVILVHQEKDRYFIPDEYFNRVFPQRMNFP